MISGACILTLAAVAGCGSGSSWGTHIRELINETKRQAKAADIQAALIPIFSDPNIRYDSSEMNAFTNRLPPQIISLPIFSDNSSNILADWFGSTNALFVVGGGGFGSWGIVVVRPGSDENPQSKTITLWEEGVYFLNEYR